MKNPLRLIFRRSVIIGLSLVLGIAFYRVSTVRGPFNHKVKYVFLFIGDGMGLAHVTATERFLEKTDGQPLAFTRFPVTGFVTTGPANTMTTCSAAAATALATGVKTRNGRMGMDVAGKKNLTGIAEQAGAAGFKIGLVSSVPLNHATPAGFYAHRPSRNQYYEIGLDMVASRVDYLGGGNLIDRKGKGRTKEDLLDLAEKAGWRVARNAEQFKALQADTGRVLAVHDEKKCDHKMALPYAIDHPEGDLTLADYTRKGIELLDNPQGFFMMVEGGKIDWAAHGNDAATVVHEVADFDRAVRVALEFYKEHPKQTLIVITADHETGGMAQASYETGFGDVKRLAGQTMSGSAFMDMIGPYREKTSPHAAQIEDLLPRIEQAFGLKPLSAQEEKDLFKKALEERRWQYWSTLSGHLQQADLADLKQALLLSLTESKEDRENRPLELRRAYGGNDALYVTCTRLAGRKAGVGWTSYGHTSIPVPVFAIGSGSGRFGGMIDNTDIPKTIAALLKVTLPDVAAIGGENGKGVEPEAAVY